MVISHLRSMNWGKKFTFLGRDDIAALEEATRSAPEKREAQRVLAREVTNAVHGGEQVARAQHASTLLFGEDIATLSVDEVLAVFDDVPSTELSSDAIAGDGIGIVDLVAPTNPAARTELMKTSNGMYLVSGCPFM